MKRTGEFEGRKVAVIGVGRAGSASARALRAAGADVTLYDPKSKDQLGQTAVQLESEGFHLVTGSSDYPGIEVANLLVPSPGVRPDAPVLLAARARGTEVMGEIEVAYRLSEAPILAVTGTNGKSTTVAMCGAMLENWYPHTWVGGNLAPGEPLPSLVMKAGSDDLIIAEVSSFQLEQISTFRPVVAILTNLTPDHFDRHRDLAEYGAAKARIFENGRENDLAIINADSLAMPELGLKEKLRARIGLFGVDRERVETAMETATQWTGRTNILGAWVEQHYLVVSDGKEFVEIHPIAPVSAIPVPGRHNVENALAAGLATWWLEGRVEEGLRRFQAVPHRMEPVAMVEGVRYINNSMCTNPAALVASLLSYEEPVILITGGKNKNLDFSEAGPVISRHAKAVILIGVAAEDLSEAIGTEGAPLKRAHTMMEAVQTARSLAHSGDVVMLAPGCASMDMFNDFMDRGEQFVEVVKSFAEDRPHPRPLPVPERGD